MKPTLFKTTIQDLVVNFRRSLIEYTKCLTRVGVELCEKTTGDAWEEVSGLLYAYLILESIEYSLPEDQVGNLVFPKYEMTQFDYSKGSFLICSPKKINRDYMYVFFRFIRKGASFDKVLCYKLNKNLETCGEQIFSWNDVKFQLSYMPKKGIRQIISNIVISD